VAQKPINRRPVSPLSFLLLRVKREDL